MKVVKGCKLKRVGVCVLRGGRSSDGSTNGAGVLRVLHTRFWAFRLRAAPNTSNGPHAHSGTTCILCDRMHTRGPHAHSVAACTRGDRVRTRGPHAHSVAACTCGDRVHTRGPHAHSVTACTLCDYMHTLRPQYKTVGMQNTPLHGRDFRLKVVPGDLRAFRLRAAPNEPHAHSGTACTL